MERTLPQVGSWAARLQRPMFTLVCVSLAIGFATDRFVGGRAALYGGMLQALVLIVFLFYSVVFLLFAQDYGASVTVFLESQPVKGLRIAILIGGAAFTVLLLVVGIHSFDPNAPDTSTKAAHDRPSLPVQ